MLNISLIASFKKVAIINTVTCLTVNSVMDIFLQVLQRTAVFKTIKNTFCQRVNQNTCMLSLATSAFKNCMYIELTWYLYHYLILFSQNSYKKEAQIFIKIIH